VSWVIDDSDKTIIGLHIILQIYLWSGSKLFDTYNMSYKTSAGRPEVPVETLFMSGVDSVWG